MAYTIVKSDGSILTTIADGTINTTSTSMGLPGRNYAGYGQTLDTNIVWQLENFADSTPPAHPLRGQLWYDTGAGVMKVCPSDGESNSAAWLSLTATSSGGTTSFGAVTVSGTLQAGNISTAGNLTVTGTATLGNLAVTTSANISSANITAANIGTLTTTAITTGGATTAGTLTGVWTITGNSASGGASALILNQGGIYIANAGSGNLYGIRCDNYMWANGDAVSFSGTYSNSNVGLYLPTYSGNVGNAATASGTQFIGTKITTGANTTAGTITGNWTLTTGSKLNATYADLAERFEADIEYDAGTVVQIGGTKEITAVQYELSEDVFGVISDTAGYLMNATAGSDKTHPPVAVSGRVKVKVIGAVKKGDRLVSAGKGIARARSEEHTSELQSH